MGPGDHGGMAYEVAIIYHVNPYCVRVCAGVWYNGFGALVAKASLIILLKHIWSLEATSKLRTIFDFWTSLLICNNMLGQYLYNPSLVVVFSLVAVS
jgi:hypothetical protein